MDLKQASDLLVEATNCIRQIIGDDFFNMFINKNIVEIHVTNDYFKKISAGNKIDILQRASKLYPWEKWVTVDGISFYALYERLEEEGSL